MAPALQQPDIEVRRSKRRRRTVSAYRDGERIVVLIPASFSLADEKLWVRTMVERIEKAESRSRLTDDDLRERALALSDRYLGGLATPGSVRWVSNQNTRWGSCTLADGSMRLSERLKMMPVWVLDYVLVHELAHFLEPSHDAKFWAWVEHYPHAEKAKGYLLGWSEASQITPPQEFQE